MKKIILFLALLTGIKINAQIVGGYLPINSSKSATVGALRVNGALTATGVVTGGSFVTAGTSSVGVALTTPSVYGSSSASGGLVIRSNSTATPGVVSISPMTNGSVNIGSGGVNPSALGLVRISQGTSTIDIGELAGGNAAIWFNQGTPSTSNYAFLGNSTTNSIFNAPSGTLFFRVANTSYMTVTTNSAAITGSLSVSGTTTLNGVSYIGTNKIAAVLTGSATLDFGSTVAGTSTDLTLTVTGAVDGDPVYIGVANGSTLSNGVFTAWVSATNTVTVRFSNNSLAATLDPASGTFKATVNKN